MFGKPAAEIEAVDLEAKPVKLADYRGKMVVLAFVSSPSREYNDYYEGIPLRDYNDYMLGLIKIRRRFKDQPLAILALHDASLTSLTKYQEALKPLRNQVAGEIPIRFLLDRPPIGAGKGPYGRSAGEWGSGRTRDAYEIVQAPATYVIDKNGKLVFGLTGDASMLAISMGKEGQLVRDSCRAEIMEEARVDHKLEMDHLEGALEDQFGLARSHPAETRRRTLVRFALAGEPEGIVELER